MKEMNNKSDALTFNELMESWKQLIYIRTHPKPGMKVLKPEVWLVMVTDAACESDSGLEDFVKFYDKAITDRRWGNLIRSSINNFVSLSLSQGTLPCGYGNEVDKKARVTRLKNHLSQ